MAGKKGNKWLVVVIVLAVLAFISLILSGLIGLFLDVGKAGNVALIKVEGPIVVSTPGTFERLASSSDIIGFIREAEKNPSVKAIIVDINSPGGSPVGSDEIARAVKESNKTTVAVIRELGASGAYWIASSADHVIANRMSITGSVGVLGSYLEFDDFLERYNITYRRLVSGKYKDAGSPLKDLESEEREMIQEMLDEIHKEFVSAVSENRNLSEEQEQEISEGMIMTGKQAENLGLVDELGGVPEAEDHISRTLNITPSLLEYQKEPTLADILFSALSDQSFSLGRGIGSGLLEKRTGIII